MARRSDNPTCATLRNRRYYARLKARRICTTIDVGEDAIQALVWSGDLPDHLAHLKDEIRRAAQAAFDRFVAQQLNNIGRV